MSNLRNKTYRVVCKKCGTEYIMEVDGELFCCEQCSDDRWIDRDDSDNVTIFVYGTLKKGFANHELLKYSKFLGVAKTVHKYPLIAPYKAFPYLVDNAEVGHQVHGELYSVDCYTLWLLDELEGEPHHYFRSFINVLNEYEKEICVQIYFLDEDNAKKFEHEPMMESFENPFSDN